MYLAKSFSTLKAPIKNYFIAINATRLIHLPSHHLLPWFLAYTNTRGPSFHRILRSYLLRAFSKQKIHRPTCLYRCCGVIAKNIVFVFISQVYMRTERPGSRRLLYVYAVLSFQTRLPLFETIKVIYTIFKKYLKAV